MNIANIYRDRTLDMLSEENVGETVRVAGWVENIDVYKRQIKRPTTRPKIIAIASLNPLKNILLKIKEPIITTIAAE